PRAPVHRVALLLGADAGGVHDDVLVQALRRERLAQQDLGHGGPADVAGAHGHHTEGDVHVSIFPHDTRPRGRAARPAASYGEAMRRGADDVVAVTGASGRLGARLALRLAAESAQQRLVVRDPARAPRLPDGAALPDSEVAVIGSYADGEGMRRALDGV